MDARIPFPGSQTICGQAITGRAICGAALPADTYADFPTALDGGTVALTIENLIQPTSGDLVLPDGTAEVLTSSNPDVTLVVEITGYADMIGDTAKLLVDRVIQVAATGVAELSADPADLFSQRNVIIPEPFTGDAICGKVICGVPPTLCGQGVRGDNYFDFRLDLDGAQVTLTLEELLVLGDSAALDLDGGPVIVNPVLMPFECLDLDLEAITCTDLDLATIACEPLDVTPLASEPLDLAEPVCEVLDLEALVPVEA